MIQNLFSREPFVKTKRALFLLCVFALMNKCKRASKIDIFITFYFSSKIMFVCLFSIKNFIPFTKMRITRKRHIIPNQSIEAFKNRLVKSHLIDAH